MATILDMPGREVRDEALTWPEKARALTITDAASCGRAAELLKGIKALRQKVSETFRPHIKKALEAHRALIAEERKADAPLVEAETLIKRGLSAYESDQRRRAQEEERRQREAARQAEEARVLEQAAAMEREGTTFGDTALVEEAHALIEQPIEAPPVAPVQPETPKVAGVSYRDVWKFRVVDEAKVPREYLTVDEKKIGGVVRALKGAAKIPGVEVYSERVVAAGSR